MGKNIVQDELLDLEVDHHVPVELALEQPAERLQVGDVVAHLGVAAGRPAAPGRHGAEHQGRGPAARGRPARPRLEGTVVYGYGRRGGGQAVRGEVVGGVGGVPGVLEGEDLVGRSTLSGHLNSVSP